MEAKCFSCGDNNFGKGWSCVDIDGEVCRVFCPRCREVNTTEYQEALIAHNQYKQRLADEFGEDVVQWLYGEHRR